MNALTSGLQSSIHRKTSNWPKCEFASGNSHTGMQPAVHVPSAQHNSKKMLCISLDALYNNKTILFGGYND